MNSIAGCLQKVLVFLTENKADDETMAAFDAIRIRITFDILRRMQEQAIEDEIQ